MTLAEEHGENCKVDFLIGTNENCLRCAYHLRTKLITSLREVWLVFASLVGAKTICCLDDRKIILLGFQKTFGAIVTYVWCLHI